MRASETAYKPALNGTSVSATRIIHRSLRASPPLAVGGEGVWLIDAAGQRYLDASGGAAVSCLGHGHPDVLAAMHAQIDRLAYAHTAFFTTEVGRDAGRPPGRKRAGGPGAASISSRGGSEAMEAALKLARQYFVESRPARAHAVHRAAARATTATRWARSRSAATSGAASSSRRC